MPQVARGEVGDVRRCRRPAPSAGRRARRTTAVSRERRSPSASHSACAAISPARASSPGAVQPRDLRGRPVGQEVAERRRRAEAPPRRARARRAAACPDGPTIAVSASRYSGSAASAPSAGSARRRISRSWGERRSSAADSTIAPWSARAARGDRAASRCGLRRRSDADRRRPAPTPRRVQRALSRRPGRRAADGPRISRLRAPGDAGQPICRTSGIAVTGAAARRTSAAGEPTPRAARLPDRRRAPRRASAPAACRPSSCGRSSAVGAPA